MADNQNNTSHSSAPGPDLPGASDDLLEELRRKTAELAGKVANNEEQKDRVLHVDEDPVDIFEELEAKDQKIPKQLNQIKDDKGDSSSPAAELVRKKLQKLYNKQEPDAALEAIEAEQATRRSKHQQFMYDLTTSGKSLADIQTAWHNYYVQLPDDEKHTVWREFYQMQTATSKYAQSQKAKTETHKLEPAAVAVSPGLPHHEQNNRSTSGIKNQLLDKVNAGGKLKPIHHFKSLLFGLGLASIVGLIITFTFFNEVFIAPFITPSQNVSATPIIGPASSDDISDESKIIIPKINLEVPVVFDLNSIEEQDIQDALEEGVVHYATTPNPGEIGNSVIVGHSSNNILNSGKYKFAFVLLKRLEPEDLFYVQKDGVRYTYKVYRKEIVPPTSVDVLDTQERDNTMTLITCDPPGTSINRLVVVAEQIDPDPSKNTKSTAPPIEEIEGASEDLDSLPSNAPSLWSRLWPF